MHDKKNKYVTWSPSGFRFWFSVARNVIDKGPQCLRFSRHVCFVYSFQNKGVLFFKWNTSNSLIGTPARLYTQMECLFNLILKETLNRMWTHVAFLNTRIHLQMVRENVKLIDQNRESWVVVVLQLRTPASFHHHRFSYNLMSEGKRCLKVAQSVKAHQKMCETESQIIHLQRWEMWQKRGYGNFICRSCINGLLKL